MLTIREVHNLTTKESKGDKISKPMNNVKNFHKVHHRKTMNNVFLSLMTSYKQPQRTADICPSNLILVYTINMIKITFS